MGNPKSNGKASANGESATKGDFDFMRLAKTVNPPDYLRHLMVLDNYTGPINVVKGKKKK